MKRLALFLTAVLLFAGCAAKPAAEPDAWAEVRAAAQEAGSLCAVAYLGFDGEMPEDIAYIDAGGDDVYVIIPADPGAAVTIGRVELSEDGELAPTGETLYTGGGTPVILRCNVSDIMPNTLVTVTDSAGNMLSASPSISLRDGSVWMEGAYDFTEYPEGMEREG